LKKHKPWFDEALSKFVDQRKQAKLQWLQDPTEINGGKLKIEVVKPADTSISGIKRENI
jgi:hypothetical protein